MYTIIKQKLKSTLTEKQLSKIRKINSLKSLGSLAYQELRTKKLGQFFPQKPTTINMLVNDVCNSRCQMCLIWQQKKDKELTPDELAEILSDGLFSEIKYIGVSGGEPTLRTDLAEIYRVICKKKPKITGTGIITNGIIHDTVKQRILDAAEICRSYGVEFNVMVSLDGIGEVHDTVRGRKNNFDSAIALLKFFHEETDIPTSFGCTITSSNALYVDELLDYAKLSGLYGRFRVAEYIERLYNSGQTEFIRSFDEKTLYHLGLFFFRVEHDFEQNSTFQKTYRNIRGMLVENKPRLIGCPYQSTAVVLTSKGELLYCSPKSPSIGSTLEFSAEQLYFSNLDKRKEIIDKDCSNCTHDYHEPVTLKERLLYYIKRRRRHKYNCSNLLNLATKLTKLERGLINLDHLSSKNVLIVGWYGTETVGDKAILWSVINDLRRRNNPPEKIYLASLYPFVSNWTVKEMSLEEISVIETYSQEFEKVCKQIDEVVVGGGPLMDIEPLNHILYSFIIANKSGAITRIEGCGIGPLELSLYTKVVSEIIRLADHITLRDQASAQRSTRDFSGKKLVTVIPDPATNYVQFIKSSGDLDTNIPPLGTAKNISCFLREWGEDYIGNLSREEYILTKYRFEEQIAEFLLTLADNYSANIHLLPMHSFSVGGDDRIFNRKLATNLSNLLTERHLKTQVSFARETVSPQKILQSMYSSKFNICMRFHSVLFAETLGVPYIAIDYTNGGKIKAFLEEKGKLDRLISLADIANGFWKDKLSYSSQL
ncbi:MAG: polysaccharide pyruvyl transferase family protein [Gomphosphaeria aponina SAG 52.96 = DSM 107014]|uniref:Polysaccharide pyruvyl transferase family protein n=1 Tax=Gomphosphaeria aponina SAG 52.96 = DSM 107014 TaxID=1521640 RepID=A0A941GVP6_9CHRO|nr:polysaccharide pyruvyl transferase family protein [Gomphosphaeria aponina SAG 52.96 = DSM 107014]